MYLYTSYYEILQFLVSSSSAATPIWLLNISNLCSADRHASKVCLSSAEMGKTPASHHPKSVALFCGIFPTFSSTVASCEDSFVLTTSLTFRYFSASFLWSSSEIGSSSKYSILIFYKNFVGIYFLVPWQPCNHLDRILREFWNVSRLW